MEVLYADPDHLCKSCLPVRGDDIIGTKPRSPLPHTHAAFVTTHRHGCALAQRALEQSLRKRNEGNTSPPLLPGDDIEGVPLHWNPFKDEEGEELRGRSPGRSDATSWEYYNCVLLTLRAF